jgi:hypothetical protein
MKKVIPPIKVKDIPFFEGKISKADKEKWGMILSGGKDNYYRIMFAKGQGASRKDRTRDKVCHHHTCCLSRVPSS